MLLHRALGGRFTEVLPARVALILSTPTGLAAFTRKPNDVATLRRHPALTVQPLYLNAKGL